MTEYQSFMLSVCFGCTVGFLLGTIITAISLTIDERREKKKLKGLEKEDKNTNTDIRE